MGAYPSADAGERDRLPDQSQRFPKPALSDQGDIALDVDPSWASIGAGGLANLVDDSASRPTTAVTAKRDIAVVNINSNRMLMAYGFMARIFNIFEEYGIVIDLISTSEVSVSMTVDNDKNLDRAIVDLQELGEVTVRRDLAILSLVGRGQRHCVGLAGRMFSELGKENINLEMISQGASEINISCVIEDELADRALRIIHNALVR